MGRNRVQYLTIQSRKDFYQLPLFIFHENHVFFLKKIPEANRNTQRLRDTQEKESNPFRQWVKEMQDENDIFPPTNEWHFGSAHPFIPSIIFSQGEFQQIQQNSKFIMTSQFLKRCSAACQLFSKM